MDIFFYQICVYVSDEKKMYVCVFRRYFELKEAFSLNNHLKIVN